MIIDFANLAGNSLISGYVVGLPPTSPGGCRRADGRASWHAGAGAARWVTRRAGERADGWSDKWTSAQTRPASRQSGAYI